MTNFKQVVGFAFPPRIYTGVAKSILTAMGIVLNGIFKGFIQKNRRRPVYYTSGMFFGKDTQRQVR